MCVPKNLGLEESEFSMQILDVRTMMRLKSQKSKAKEKSAGEVNPALGDHSPQRTPAVTRLKAKLNLKFYNADDRFAVRHETSTKRH